MTKKLQELIDNAEPMTPEQKEQQHRSFAYGNAAISNPDVTREMVDEVVDEQPHQRYVVLAEPLVNGITRDGAAGRLRLEN